MKRAPQKDPPCRRQEFVCKLYEVIKDLDKSLKSECNMEGHSHSGYSPPAKLINAQFKNYDSNLAQSSNIEEFEDDEPRNPFKPRPPKVDVDYDKDPGCCCPPGCCEDSLKFDITRIPNHPFVDKTKKRTAHHIVREPYDERSFAVGTGGLGEMSFRAAGVAEREEFQVQQGRKFGFDGRMGNQEEEISHKLAGIKIINPPGHKGGIGEGGQEIECPSEMGHLPWHKHDHNNGCWPQKSDGYGSGGFNTGTFGMNNLCFLVPVNGAISQGPQYPSNPHQAMGMGCFVGRAA